MTQEEEEEEEEGIPMDVSVPALIELRVPSVNPDRGNLGMSRPEVNPSHRVALGQLGQQTISGVPFEA